MVYEYNRKVLENYINGRPKKDEEKFVGYLLPDGSPYEVVDHNLIGKATYFRMILDLISSDYNAKDKILKDVSVSDPLDKILITYLKNISHDEAYALNKFLKNSSIDFGDLLVGLFHCHKVSRFNMEILTSEIDNKMFYNYILEKFAIKTVPRIVYVNNEFKIIDKEYLPNDYLKKEIESIQNDSFSGEEYLFHR